MAKHGKYAKKKYTHIEHFEYIYVRFISTEEQTVCLYPVPLELQTQFINTTTGSAIVSLTSRVLLSTRR